MGIYIGCIFENDFHNRKDLEASKAFMLNAIDTLKEHYGLDNNKFRLEVDEEDNYCGIDIDSLNEISSLILCDGMWCVELSQKYELLFFSDLYYLNMLKEVASCLGAKEMWVCNDLQIWRGNGEIYNQSLTMWMEYLRGKGIDNIKEFPTPKELSQYEYNGSTRFPYEEVYHIDF